MHVEGKGHSLRRTLLTSALWHVLLVSARAMPLPCMFTQGTPPPNTSSGSLCSWQEAYTPGGLHCLGCLHGYWHLSLPFCLRCSLLTLWPLSLLAFLRFFRSCCLYIFPDFYILPLLLHLHMNCCSSSGTLPCPTVECPPLSYQLKYYLPKDLSWLSTEQGYGFSENPVFLFSVTCYHCNLLSNSLFSVCPLNLGTVFTGTARGMTQHTKRIHKYLRYDNWTPQTWQKWILAIEFLVYKFTTKMAPTDSWNKNECFKYFGFHLCIRCSHLLLKWLTTGFMCLFESVWQAQIP